MEEVLARFPHDKQQPRRSTAAKNRYALTPVDTAILQALAELRFMTAEQILRFRGLSQHSLPKLQHKLKILSGNTPAVPCEPYVQRFYQARYTPRGSLPFVYTLGTPGKKHLQAIGFAVKTSDRIRKVTKRLPSDIEHHLAINEFIIACKHIQQQEPAVSLYDSQHDWLLKHAPIAVTLYRGPHGTAVATKFVPDGLVEFRIDLGNRKAPKRVFLEMDMNTHERHEFKKKIAAYCEFFASRTYTKLFGNVRNVVVLFATPAGEKRCEEMRRWTHEQFERPLYAPASYLKGTSTPDAVDYGLFLFASLPKGGLDPRQTLLAPRCYPLLAQEPQPLLRLPRPPDSRTT